VGSGIPASVHRIRLENEEFEGRNNAYLFVGDGPTVLVDPGVARDDVRSQLLAGLSDHGVGVTDLDAIVVTHWHPDHSGLAGSLQDESGATVYVHEADAPVVEQDPEARDAMDALRTRRFDEWAVPEADQAALREIFEAVSRAGWDAAAVEPFAEGDEIRAGDETLRVLHSPGHTAGLSSLVVEGTGEALVGDAVLPVYTPNVGGADLRVERPLGTYVETLERLEAREFDRLYPGHRDPIDDPRARIHAILDHHAERTGRVVQVLAEHGPATAWEVSDHLFGELSGIHILHGPGEAWAHLDELVARGDVEHEDGRYRLVVDPDAARPDVRDRA